MTEQLTIDRNKLPEHLFGSPLGMAKDIVHATDAIALELASLTPERMMEWAKHAQSTGELSHEDWKLLGGRVLESMKSPQTLEKALRHALPEMLKDRTHLHFLEERIRKLGSDCICEEGEPMELATIRWLALEGIETIHILVDIAGIFAPIRPLDHEIAITCNYVFCWLLRVVVELHEAIARVKLKSTHRAMTLAGVSEKNVFELAAALLNKMARHVLETADPVAYYCFLDSPSDCPPGQISQDNVGKILNALTGFPAFDANLLCAEIANAAKREWQSAANSAVWITISEAEKLSGVNKGTISRAAKNGEITTNGRTGRELRVDNGSFSQWALKRSSTDSTSIPYVPPAEIKERARRERQKREVRYSDD
jgi:hypothetical protein